MKVLFVDDYRNDAETLAEFASRLGHAAMVATSCHEALFRAAAEPPGMILVDLRLARSNGHELCHRFRGFALLAPTRYIALKGVDATEGCGRNRG